MNVKSFGDLGLLQTLVYPDLPPNVGLWSLPQKYFG